MAIRIGRPGAGRGGGPWPGLLVLSLAVVAASACVLWFMAAAVRNERLAVRQRLIEVYRQRILAGRTALEGHWARKLAALAEADRLPAPQAFAAAARSGVAPAAVVLDVAGRPAYPADAPAETDPPPDEPAWDRARELEYGQDRPGEAAQEYVTIARQAGQAGQALRHAQALRAQARCLARAGQTAGAAAAMEELCQLPATDTDPAVRRIAAGAALRLLELAGDANAPAFAPTAARLAAWLNDYAAAPLPAAQRRFLMRSLAELWPACPPVPMRQAEDLAAEYLAAEPHPAEPEMLSYAAKGGLWRLASADGRIVAVFPQDALAAELTQAGGLAEPFAGARLVLRPPHGRRPDGEPLAALPAGRHMPGWELEARLEGDDPFAAGARQQIALYTWTGVVSVGLIAAAGLAAGGLVARQMRLARLRNDLIATVSHELKTPLASMRVLVDTLLEGRCPGGAAGEYLHLIAKENERLSRLIDNFLTFSRMERGRHAFEPAPLAMGEVVAAAVDAVRERFAEAGADIHAEVAADLPLVQADRDALVTVALNLLDNALKYSPDDRRITIRVYAADGDVCLAVSDHGIGLSKRAMKKVFGRFYQVDQSLSRRTGGCGLGLSIVRFIVESHGGGVEVASQPGKGSTFTVRLPAAGQDEGHEPGAP